MPIFRKYQEPFIDMLRCLANNNPRDFPNIRFGIMLSNYYQEHQHHYQEDSYIFLKTRLRRYQRLWPNIYQEEPFDQALDHMPQTSFLLKRKMGNYIQYKIIILSTNGQRRIAMYPH